jgi:hypothetical protein
MAVACLSWAAASRLEGQQASLSMGGVHARFADTVSGSAGAIAGRLAFESPTLRAVFDGDYTRFTTGSWASRLGGSAVGVQVLRSGLALGLRVEAEWDYLGQSLWSGTTTAGPLVAVPAGGWLALVEVSAGAVRRMDATSDPMVHASLALRRVVGPWSMDAGLAGTRAGLVRFADLTVAVDYRRSAFGFGASVGARTGDLAGDPWLQGQGELRLTPWASLEGAVGTYPQDLTGFTSGAFVRFGMRLGAGPRSLASRAAGFRRTGTRATERVRIEPVAPGTTRVTFVLAGAARVEIAGEWNAWTPVALDSLGHDAWQATLPLGAGVYHFSLVVDGTRWVVPGGVPIVPDDFGGEAGLLIVGGSRR